MDLVSRYWKTEHRIFDILNASLNLKPRPATMAMKRTGARNITAVEVGVFYGENARSILRTLDIDHLYLIDPYEDYTCAGVTVKMDGIERAAKKRLKPWEKKITWIKKYSHDAVYDIPKADFIYLDANHDYEYISKDLPRYYNRMKQGGIFGGHDMKVFHMGTIQAVIEFADEYHLKLQAEPDDWYVEIP